MDTSQRQPYGKSWPLLMTNSQMINSMVKGDVTKLPTLSFTFILEMIAEIDTDSSGTVDFDGKRHSTPFN